MVQRFTMESPLIFWIHSPNTSTLSEYLRVTYFHIIILTFSFTGSKLKCLDQEKGQEPKRSGFQPVIIELKLIEVLAELQHTSTGHHFHLFLESSPSSLSL